MVLGGRTASSLSTAAARVALRFYFFALLLVSATIYLPHRGSNNPVGLAGLALLTVGVIAYLGLRDWSGYPLTRLTVLHVATGCSLLALLIALTGGHQSSYGLLFFLLVFFSYHHTRREIFAITTVASACYLLPYLYEQPDPRSFTTSSVTVFFFYTGAYLLSTLMDAVLRKNKALADLNRELLALYSISDNLIADLEQGTLPDALPEKLREHVPTSYCIILLIDGNGNLIARLASPVRAVTWLPPLGAIYPPDRLQSIRDVLETRQPKLIDLDSEPIDEDLKVLISRKTRAVMAVPIRSAADHMGIILFGEERQPGRAPFSNETIQLSIAFSKQVSAALSLWWSHEKLASARQELQANQDRIIRAERIASLGEVTSIMEHEINNPLSVIINWAEIYREDRSLDPQMRKRFQTMYEMALRIADVLKKLPLVKETHALST